MSRRKPRKIKPYVQFSKRMVALVTVAVTGVCIGGMALASYMLKSPESLVDIVRAYVGYAMVCFAAYSGNSAVEKWLVHTAGGADRAGVDPDSAGGLDPDDAYGYADGAASGGSGEGAGGNG